LGISQIGRRKSPRSLTCRVAVVDLEPGEHFVIVPVARGDEGPYLADGQALERRGDRVAPMNAERIASVISPPGLEQSAGSRGPSSVEATRSRCSGSLCCFRSPGSTGPGYIEAGTARTASCWRHAGHRGLRPRSKRGLAVGARSCADAALQVRKGVGKSSSTVWSTSSSSRLRVPQPTARGRPRGGGKDTEAFAYPDWWLPIWPRRS
jgi:hypothetical protein